MLETHHNSQQQLPCSFAVSIAGAGTSCGIHLIGLNKSVEEIDC